MLFVTWSNLSWLVKSGTLARFKLPMKQHIITCSSDILWSTGPWGRNVDKNFNQNENFFFWQKCMWNCVSKMLAILSQPQFVNVYFTQAIKTEVNYFSSVKSLTFIAAVYKLNFNMQYHGHYIDCLLMTWNINSDLSDLSCSDELIDACLW